MDAPTALLAAAALHAGFQAVVTVVVYPALVDAARAAPRAWPVIHRAHGRRISVLVAPVYGAVLAAWAWTLTTQALGPALVVAGAGSVVSGVATAAVAGPTHARLGRAGPVPALLTRLLVADRVRFAGAVVTLAGAALAV